jgi:RNA polymerase primary sigma factor
VPAQRLTAPEERDLVIAAERGDADASRRLVETFLPAIGGLARSFHSPTVGRPELLQEGVAGLLLAARRYDPELSTPFWAYASFWVRTSSSARRGASPHASGCRAYAAPAAR